MSENRPHSRRRNDSGKTTDVHKRGDGLGGHSVGNGNYNNRENPDPNKRRSTTRTNITRGGVGGGVLLLLAYMLFGGGIGGGSANTPTPTPTPNPTPTPVVTPAANTGGFHFGSQTTNNVTYTDASTASVNTTVANGSRKKYTQLLGNGNDTVTIMVYMCGTDLESKYGMATSDLNEMASAVQSDKVNIIIETGGTSKWKNNIITPKVNQIWKLAGNKIQSINQNLGKKAMTDPNTLAEFIKFCGTNYPANRNILIFWDHGAGSVQGYGYDELYPNQSMSVDKIAAALKAGGVKFDIIGFDACLMANMETAIAVEPYADYLLASEETEPGTGWYHTNWVNLLAKNSSTSSLELGKQIIDDFVTVRQQGATSSDKNTLSLVDLAEFKNTVPSALSAFSKKISSDVKNNAYQSVADARSVTREFAQSNRLDQIDLIHFCETLNTTESKALSKALQSCIKYNKTKNITNAYGMSIYFPYRSTQKVSAIMQIYNNIGFDSDYASAVKSFATLEASGQIVTGNSSNSLYSLFGGAPVSNGNSYSNATDIFSLLTGQSQGSSSYGLDLNSLLGGSGGVDTNSLQLISQLLGGRAHISSDSFVLSDKGEKQVLSLSEDEWSMIQTVKLNVWVDDGTGYIDLGLDNIFTFDDDGDLVMDYDGMWLALDDHIVSYYLLTDEYVDDSNYITTGYVPALLNGERVNIIIEFTPDNEGGTVIGAQKVYENDMEAKGLLPIEEGDQIDFLCDYYDYDGNYSDTYYLGEPMIADGELEVSDITVTGSDMYYGYELTDIYNASRWTPMLPY